MTPDVDVGWQQALAARRRLRPAAWFLLGELLDQGEPVTAPSRHLALLTGLGRDAVRSGLCELEAAGLIARAVERDDAGHFTPAVIHVFAARTPQAPEPAQPVSGAAATSRRAAPPTAPAVIDQLSLLDDTPTAT